MAEWHIPPDYILDNWTDEQLDLYVEKLVERKNREIEAMGHKTSTQTRRVSDKELFARAGNLIKVEKRKANGN